MVINDKVTEWFAITTRYKHEKKVHELLNCKGYTCYLPLYNKISYWKDRKKKIQQPLFNCYLFVNIDLRYKTEILETSGVVKFVSFSHGPVPIPENQIELIKSLLDKDRKIEANYSFAKGQKVKVIHGPFKGLDGMFFDTKDESRLVITLDSLNQSIAVEINADEIVPMDN